MNLEDPVTEIEYAAPALSGRSRFYYVRGELGLARRLGERCLELAATTEREDLQAEGDRLVAGPALLMGDLREAVEHCRRVVDWHESGRSEDIQLYGTDAHVVALCNLSHALWYRGFADRASESVERALASARAACVSSEASDRTPSSRAANAK